MQKKRVLSKKEIAGSIEKAGMVPVFYHSDPEICIKTVQACYEGGARVFEYTNRGEKAVANFQVIRKYISENCPEMLLAIGSVLNEADTKLFITLGADIIVSPILNEKMGEVCDHAEINWIPGCATLSEIMKGVSLGAPVIKIFPGSVLGPEFVKAVKAPVPWLKLMPTGGVEPTEENLKAWFEAGVIAVGMGSQLITEEILKKGDFEGLRKNVTAVFEIVKKFRV